MVQYLRRTLLSPLPIEGIREWKSLLLHRLSKVLALVLTVAVIPSIIASLSRGYYHFAVVNIVVYIAIVLAYLGKDRLGDLRRMLLIMLSLYTIAVAALLFVGPKGAGFLLLMIIPVFAGVASVPWVAYLTIAVNGLVVGVLAGLSLSGVLNHYLISLYEVESWVVIGVVLLCLNLFTVIFVTIAISGLENSLRHRIRLVQEKEKQNQLLTKLNVELDRFLYSVSHDIRAPVASILGLADLARHENDAQRKDRYVRLIDDSAQGLDRFIRRIIEYAQNKHLAIEHKVIAIEALVWQTVDQLKHHDGWAETEVVTHFPADCLLYSDQARLQIIFTNLITNAFKYRNTHVASRLDIYCEQHDHQTVIRFQDNGRGISSEHQPHIFTMFYRATNQKPGNGIGLYIVKESVEALRGTITVTSERGRGSTFELCFPHVSPDKAVFHQAAVLTC